MSDDMSDEDMMGLPGPVNMTAGETAGLSPGVGDAPKVQLAAGPGFTPEQRRAQYESLLQNPNAHAFLNTIAQPRGRPMIRCRATRQAVQISSPTIRSFP